MNLIEVNQSLIGQPLHYICRHFLLCPLSILYSFLNTFGMYFCTFCNLNQQWISVPHIVGYVYTLHIHNLISKENDRTKAKDMSFVKNHQSKNLSGWWHQKDVFEWLFLIIELHIIIANSSKGLEKTFCHEMHFRLDRAIMKFWVFYIAKGQ